MKLVRQTALEYRQDRSDKVYEIDLCAADGGQYLVNFRYGRRGSTLREGTKTNLAVSKDRAESIFDKLVDSKVAKGYRVVRTGAPQGAQAIVQPDPPGALNPKGDDPRAAAILKRLAKRTDDDDWALDRVIWRAGELGIVAAIPHLVSLSDGAPSMRRYCVASSLGWTGALAPPGSAARDQAVQALGTLGKGDPLAPSARRATEALLKIHRQGGGAEYAALQAEIAQRLPEPLRALVADYAPPDELAAAAAALGDLITEDVKGGPVPLLHLYLHGGLHARPHVLRALETMPFRNAHFRIARYIFKAAEYGRDGEVFGLILRRIERSRAIAGRGFKPATRHYLRRRSWRTLRRLALASNPDYVELACGVLLALKDEDSPEPTSVSRYVWTEGNYQIVQSWSDRYAAHYAFNHIVRGDSRRHVIRKASLRFALKPGEEPQAAPPRREEPFGALWTRHPDRLIGLLLQSGCEPVHHFAARAVRACPEHLMAIPVSAVAGLLSRPYEVTAQLGFEQATKRYDANHPDPELLLAAANSPLAAARNASVKWIEAGRSTLQRDGAFLAGLIASRQVGTRSFAKRLLPSLYIPTDTAKTCVARVLAELIGPDNQDGEWSADVAQLLMSTLSDQIRSLSPDIVADVVAHPMAAVQVFGGQILLHQARYGASPRGDLLQSLLDSEHTSTRAIGVELLGTLADHELLERAALVADLVTHKRPELRQNAQPIAVRLARTSEAFATTLLIMVVDALTRRDVSDDVQRDLFTLLTDGLADRLGDVPEPSVWRLLRAPSSSAGEVAGVILEKWRADKLSMVQIVELGSHDVLRVREAARAFMGSDTYRVKKELPQAVRLLDARWADSRQFAADFFDKELNDDDFTPEVLINICDSNRDDVQQFGRDMVVRHFERAAGPDYLIKLSEHPSRSMQAFVSGLLSAHAAGDPQRLGQLSGYVRVALARVNGGRVAKDRIFDFMASEIDASADAATIIAGILTEMSNTMAIGDKARAIALMLQIRRKYPDLQSPISVAEVEVRSAV